MLAGPSAIGQKQSFTTGPGRPTQTLQDPFIIHITLTSAETMNSSYGNETLLGLRSNVSKLFTLSRYYSAYVQDRSSPGLLTTLLKSIQCELGPEDHELSRIISCYAQSRRLSHEEFESLRKPLIHACQALVVRRLSNGDA